jgi:hypothetical protein
MTGRVKPSSRPAATLGECAAVDRASRVCASGCTVAAAAEPLRTFDHYQPAVSCAAVVEPLGGVDGDSCVAIFW